MYLMLLAPYSSVPSKILAVRLQSIPFVTSTQILTSKVSYLLMQVMLSIISIVKWPFVTAYINVLHWVEFSLITYRVGINLYIGGQSIMSVEGATQGDRLAMAMYSLGTLPLIQRSNPSNLIHQVWYADHGTAAGSLNNLLKWWQNFTDLGPKFGYYIYPNATKSILLVKPDNLSVAQQLFTNLNLIIVSDGACVLGHLSGLLSLLISGSRRSSDLD